MQVPRNVRVIPFREKEMSGPLQAAELCLYGSGEDHLALTGSKFRRKGINGDFGRAVSYCLVQWPGMFGQTLLLGARCFRYNACLEHESVSLARGAADRINLIPPISRSIFHLLS